MFSLLGWLAAMQFLLPREWQLKRCGRTSSEWSMLQWWDEPYRRRVSARVWLGRERAVHTALDLFFF
jgi:hypothetical protein